MLHHFSGAAFFPQNEGSFRPDPLTCWEQEAHFYLGFVGVQQQVAVLSVAVPMNHTSECLAVSTLCSKKYTVISQL